MRILLRSVGLSLGLGVIVACQTPYKNTDAESSTAVGDASCDTSKPIGRFDTSKDIFLPHFDIKPDVDDLHSIAAVGSFLKWAEFACVDYFAVSGTYGTQGGYYIPAAALMTHAFGDDWVDAHRDFEQAVTLSSERASQALKRGGDIWIMEAGQSDFSASLVRSLLSDFGDEESKSRVHIVQHSQWNEDSTSEDARTFVQAQTDYIRIDDGNFGDNSSPDFNEVVPDLWNTLLEHPDLSALWTEAKRLADLHNPDAAYVNPTVSQGGFDFSDTVEAAYIFGFDDLKTVEDFIDYVK